MNCENPRNDFILLLLAVAAALTILWISFYIPS